MIKGLGHGSRVKVLKKYYSGSIEGLSGEYYYDERVVQTVQLYMHSEIDHRNKFIEMHQNMINIIYDNVMIG